MLHNIRTNKDIPTIILTIIIIATIPLAIYSIIHTNLDPRKEAYEQKAEQCEIILPHVNPSTMAINKNYQMIAHASFPNEKIQSIEIKDSLNKEIFNRSYKEPRTKISEKFIFTPTETTTKQLTGTLQTTKNTYPCKMGNGNITIKKDNHPPSFITNPYIESTSQKKAIKPGEKYSYILEARDKDADNIQYHYSFTPNADWLHKNVVSSGQSGNLKIELTGIPEKTGTYLANVFIHDGYNRHLSSQSWIIEVNPEGKEIEEIEDTVTRKEPDVAGEVDNKIQLEEPTISDLTPIVDTNVRTPNPTISANLNASINSKIDKESIKFKINQKSIREDSNILQISSEEVIITYKPTTELEEGKHKAYVYFQDSDGKEQERQWTFSIQLEQDETELFGIPLSNIIIITFGFILVLTALFIPWILYIAWKRNTECCFEENEMPEIEDSKSLDELLGEEDEE